MATEDASTVIHWARAYDVLVGVLTLGRERRFRSGLVDLVQLRPGQAVLDVGCGTGSLAMAAKSRVGAAGEVCGVDPSPEMIARARRKASRGRAGIRFENGSAEALPFADDAFDVVLSTLMLHHLSDDGRAAGVREIGRVLKPGGRFLAVDIGSGGKVHGHGFMHRIGSHADFDLDRLIAVIEEAGLTVASRGPITQRVLGISNLRFLVAAAPAG
ncbi:MAG TPA: methyltransferase domain-containing protein [Acidimicrobiales bacterium]|nr:methyltransferase domain-containing protein [Acidimicrobiales bacterium]